MKNYKKLYEELRQAIDGGYALATHEDALEFIYVKREWVGLTENQIDELEKEFIGFSVPNIYNFVQAIEAKLKEKNNV